VLIFNTGHWWVFMLSRLTLFTLCLTIVTPFAYWQHRNIGWSSFSLFWFKGYWYCSYFIGFVWYQLLTLHILYVGGYLETESFVLPRKAIFFSSSLHMLFIVNFSVY
jgi:hypothetical protein